MKFFDSHGNLWETCRNDDAAASAFGPRGCARPLPGPEDETAWAAARRKGMLGKAGEWDVLVPHPLQGAAWPIVLEGRKLRGGSTRPGFDGTVTAAPYGVGQFWIGPVKVVAGYTCPGGPDADTIECGEGEAVVHTGEGDEYTLATWRVVTL